jgi:hypothetical protein
MHRLFRDRGFRQTAGTVLSAIVLYASPASGQGLRPPADLALDPITGQADLSCQFRSPDVTGDDVMQGKDVELLVTVKSAGGGVKYTLTDAVQVSPQPQTSDRTQHSVRLQQAPRLVHAYQDDGHRDVDEYVVALAIDQSALPRNYDVELKFEASGKKTVLRSIQLFVGARDKAKFIDAAAATTSTPSLVAGTTSQLSLKISNNFPTYRVAVTRIVVRSDPAGLIEPFSDTTKYPIAAFDSKPVTVTLAAKRSWRQLLWPIETKPQLNVLLVYDDGYRTGIERLPQIPIVFTLDVDTSVVVLLTIICLLAGAAAGTWLRLRFATEPPPAEGRRAWERLVAAVLLGGVIAAITIVAKVEILGGTGSWRVPLHRPVAVLLIGFIVALNDPSDLIKAIRDKFRPVSAA